MGAAAEVMKIQYARTDFFLFVHTNTELAQVYLLLILSSPWSWQGYRNWNYYPD